MQFFNPTWSRKLLAQRRAEVQGQKVAQRWEEEPSPIGSEASLDAGRAPIGPFEASPDAEKAPSEPLVEASPGADEALTHPVIDASPASVLDKGAAPEASPEPLEAEATQHYSQPEPTPEPHLLACQARKPRSTSRAHCCIP